MAATASSSSSSSSSTVTISEKYDVFLSFRGEDTRYGITSHIYTALKARNIKTYLDEKSLERGHEISPALRGAIERSKISVIVLSEHYASSSWCLSELVHIHKCHKERGQVVLPIFYKVDPSHIRKQDQGSYRDAFKKHEKKYKDKADTVREWRAALKASADIAGLHYSESSRHESTLVKEVVEAILKILVRPLRPDDDFKGLIGMGNHFKKIELLLSSNSPEVRIIGIWGMPGIGKTTIADAVFSRLSHQFESYYFFKNVSEESGKYGLDKLLVELIDKLLVDEKQSSGILPNRIPEYAKDRLRGTRVLLVLDDVSEKKQLESLVGDYFASGSKIIVTTRDEGVFRGTNIKADFVKYEVKLLSFEESLQLFSLTTFREKYPPTDYKELSKKVVKYAGHNPLAITVLGSHLRSLRNPTKENWEMELEKLKEFPHDDIQKVLRISYDGLGKTDQKIFLDIACFFKGMHRRSIENILNACNFFASTGIDVLIDKSLITMSSHNNELHMHDLVQHMGWQIVRQESEEPGNRSRLWIAEDACHVFNNNKGTGQIEGIFLHTPDLDENVYMKPTVFQKIDKLRLLKIYEISRKTIFRLYLEELEYFPRSLRYLEWKKYPLQSLPSNFNPRNLVELRLHHSQLEQLWRGTKNLDNLRGIDLSHSINLTQIPDLSLAKNLETINLENCMSLLQVPWHIWPKLHKLYDLNLSHCLKLGSFPDIIDAGELKILSLEGCMNLITIQEIKSGSLVLLNLSSTALVRIPSSIGSINTISELVLSSCRSLVTLPSSISQLHSLKTLKLAGCSSLCEFPELPMNIEEVFLNETAIKEVPSSSIEHRSRLWNISFGYCKKLESLPTSIFELTSLVSLDLSDCSSLKNLPEISDHVESNLQDLHLAGSGITCLPSSIGNLTNVKRLELSGCKNLEVIGNMSRSRLTYLSIHSCMKVRSISDLPFSLNHLIASRCVSLKRVFDSNLNAFSGAPLNASNKKRFWSHREVKFDTFDYSLFDDCFNLEQNALANIVAEFKLKVLHMATQYVAPKSEVKISPAITACYPRMTIPDWFDHQCNYFDNSSRSITIPLSIEWRRGDRLGFALCAVVANSTKSADIYCEIKFKREGSILEDMSCYDSIVCSPFTGPTTSMIFPISLSYQLVMWYKYYNYDSLYKGDTQELSFEFSIRNRHNDEPSSAKLLTCGVHVLKIKELEELGIVDHNDNHMIRVDHQDNYNASLADSVTADPSSSHQPSHALEIVETELVEPYVATNNEIDVNHEHSNSTTWRTVCSVWRAVLLCCSGEID